MVGAAYASVPLYRMFCQITGYGGTTQRAETAPIVSLFFLIWAKRQYKKEHLCYCFSNCEVSFELILSKFNLTVY